MAEILDVFNQDPFSAIALTTAIEKVPFMPVGLGELNIFEPDPIRTVALAIEKRQGLLNLIPMSQRGSEGTQRTTEKRDMRYFETPRLMTTDTIYASELQNIREFGQESVLMQVETEVQRRLAGPTGLLANLEYTMEFHRLAAVQGMLLDADGSVKYNWFDEFGMAKPAPIKFTMSAVDAGTGTVDARTNTLRPLINGLVREMSRKAQGAFMPTTRIGALCGDAFYDALVNHPDVIRTYVNWNDAADLRNNSQGAAFQNFTFAGIDWINYRGSDDNSTIKIPDNQCQFFPINAPGVFRVAYAPGESMDWINTPGKPQYILPILDKDRRMWWKMEAYSYPLHICTRPEVLFTGVLA